MAFDWPQFLTDHNVHFVTDGPNCPKGDVAVKCPFCHDDPSEHMAINIDNAGWHCWRNRSHAGRSPVKLIQALIGCSYDQARLFAGQTINLPSNFLEQVQSHMTKSTTHSPRVPLKIPRNEFKVLWGSPLAKPYARYLETRGYANPISTAYNNGLYYATGGAFTGRIIFPVYFKDELVSWTGRSISKQDSLRYRSLAADREKAKAEGTQVAIGPINHYLLWYDELLDEDGTICLCEGPFDALKVRHLGQSLNIHATCFFTNSPSDQQIDLLYELLPRYRRRVLLLDQGTIPQALQTQNRLTELKIEIGWLPPEVKDPGELRSANDLLHLLA